MRRIDRLIIHHTATARETVATITAAHKKRGFATIGYHNVIGNGNGLPDGHIAAGRDHAMVGAGVKANNTGMLHVVLVGNFHQPDAGYTGRPSAEQLNALGWWLLVNAARYGITGPARISGHGEVALPKYPTACPGDQMPLRAIRGWFRANLPLFETREFEPLAGFLVRNGWEPS